MRHVRLQVLFKIYEMMRVGMSVSLIMDGLCAMSRCSWSTMTEEQGHAAASLVMKAHRDYGLQTLQARSMMVQCRPMFARCPLAQKIVRKQALIDASRTTQVGRITGRQIFLQELVRDADNAEGCPADKQAMQKERLVSAGARFSVAPSTRHSQDPLRPGVRWGGGGTVGAWYACFSEGGVRAFRACARPPACCRMLARGPQNPAQHAQDERRMALGGWRWRVVG